MYVRVKRCCVGVRKGTHGMVQIKLLCCVHSRIVYLADIQGVSKRALQLLKRIEIYTQRFELSECNKTHRVLPRVVIRNCFDLFFRFGLPHYQWKSH
jgi:hypothetical protein